MLKQEEKTAITSTRKAMEHLRPKPFTRWAGSSLRWYKQRKENGTIIVQYAGREYTDPDPQVYDIAPECIEELIEKGFIKNKPIMGGVNQFEFELSGLGENQLRIWDKEDEEKALSLLRPGVGPGYHGWSSQYRFRDKGSVEAKDGEWKDGLIFSNPMDEKWIVFLDDGTVEEYKRDC